MEKEKKKYREISVLNKLNDVGGCWIEESSRRKKDSSLQSVGFISQKKQNTTKGIIMSDLPPLLHSRVFVQKQQGNETYQNTLFLALI